jgi:hypothetical protein
MGATPIPRELTAGWQLALECWSDAPRHDTLLGIAAKHQHLAWLAGKYRDAARSNPSDPIAPARIERVRRCAALMFAMPVKPPPLPMSRAYRTIPLVLLGAVIATGIGLVVAEQRVQQRALVTRHP